MKKRFWHDRNYSFRALAAVESNSWWRSWRRRSFLVRVGSSLLPPPSWSAPTRLDVKSRSSIKYNHKNENKYLEFSIHHLFKRKKKNKKKTREGDLITIAIWPRLPQRLWSDGRSIGRRIVRRRNSLLTGLAGHRPAVRPVKDNSSFWAHDSITDDDPPNNGYWNSNNSQGKTILRRATHWYRWTVRFVCCCLWRNEGKSRHDSYHHKTKFKKPNKKE